MSLKVSREEQCLLKLLGTALTGGQAGTVFQDGEWKDTDWGKVLSEAKKHVVLPFLYDLFDGGEMLEPAQKKTLEAVSRKTVYQSYRLLFLTKYVVEFLEKKKIPAIVLKGVTAAAPYPVPELRKSGDVDILIPAKTGLKGIRAVMEEAGFAVSRSQHANHHLVCVSPDGIDVEMHIMVAEPFAYEKINRYLRQQEQAFFAHMHREEIMGVSLPVLDRPYQAFQLLLHMLQHFLYAGFGLKLLCDWVVLWNGPWTAGEQEQFVRLTEESGTRKFAELITEVCAEYLGLPKEKAGWMSGSGEAAMAKEFMAEVMEAEEFGKSSEERMVMMQGSGVLDYVHEFQHQMHLNFPKAGKWHLLWPALWTVTLVRFLRNNRKLRKVSTIEVLKKAGSRSKLMEQLQLFE